MPVPYSIPRNPCAVPLPVEARARLIYLSLRLASAPRHRLLVIGRAVRGCRCRRRQCNPRAGPVSGVQIGVDSLGNILGRYILREVVTAWLVVTAVLLVILLANQVVGVLERAAANQYPQSVVLELIGLGALQYLSILLPVGLLLGVVLAFGRLYHDSEFTAAFACGAGPRDVYVPVALLAVVAAALLAWLTLVVAPQATAEVLSVRNA